MGKLVSTVIILAISLMLAIAVSHLIMSFSKHYTRIEVIASSAHHGDPSIVVIVRNLGGDTLSITDLHLNNIPVASLIGDSIQSINPDITKNPIQVKPGEKREIKIDLNPSKWSGGEIVEISIWTSSGNKYYAIVSLS
ncbi:hypothetical protein DRO64_10065 [Candidatus Bathyarchaeota archaeon]|nr:MAG: hypothetical protein DRO64_10065 [Candidatus Bathyarchaeota archaeon]